MKLKTKVILSIVVIWSIMCVWAYINSKWILNHYYLKIEDQIVQDNMYRFNEAVNELNSVVENVGSSWSPWEDAYEFAQNKNKRFFERELGIATIAASDLDVVLIFDAKGQPVSLRALNEERTQSIALPTELFKALKPNGSLWKYIENPQPDQKKIGLFLTSKEILFFAIYPIIKSSGSGPASGSFVLARYLTQKAIDQIRLITHQDITFLRLPSILKDEKLNRIYQQLLNDKQSLFIERNKKTLTGYGLLKDFQGQPIAMIGIRMPRSIYISGLETIRYFDTAFTALGLFFVLLLFYLLKKWVIERLEKINHQLIAVGETKNFSLKFPESGKDELSYLGAEANKMLATIRRYDEKQKDLQEKIRHELIRTQNFSAQLKSAEALLKNLINAMPSMLFIVNKEGQVMDVNLRSEQKLNMNAKKILGKNLFDLLPYMKPYEDELRLAVEKKLAYKFYKVCEVRAPAENCYYSILIFPLLQSQDRLAIRIDDISEQIKMEETLTQNEKLMSMGILTAGVAHEINNPVNFVYSSVAPLSRDVDEVLVLLGQYEALSLSEHPAEKLSEIQQNQKNMDLNMLIQEIKDLLAGMEDGTQRTLGIIKSLSTFSKSDEDKMQKTDIEQAIDSTLTILHHHYKNRIKMIKEYGDIPLVDGYSGKLNQVFMNILSNAVDAISGEGEIIIKTFQPDPDHVAVKIKDNGMGISEENLKKIFDPFFTTKVVGEGTGLGLSVTQSIIRKHHGVIEVTSELGKGTEITLILPIKNSPLPAEK